MVCHVNYNKHMFIFLKKVFAPCLFIKIVKKKLFLHSELTLYWITFFFLRPLRKLLFGFKTNLFLFIDISLPCLAWAFPLIPRRARTLATTSFARLMLSSASLKMAIARLLLPVALGKFGFSLG